MQRFKAFLQLARKNLNSEGATCVLMVLFASVMNSLIALLFGPKGPAIGLDTPALQFFQAWMMVCLWRYLNYPSRSLPLYLVLCFVTGAFFGLQGAAFCATHLGLGGGMENAVTTGVHTLLLGVITAVLNILPPSMRQAFFQTLDVFRLPNVHHLRSMLRM